MKAPSARKVQEGRAKAAKAKTIRATKAERPEGQTADQRTIARLQKRIAYLEDQLKAVRKAARE
jgi:hypothetical protein